MIQPKRTKCCGCGACQQICPVQCITMTTDHEGFLYPVAETGKCINCHRCEKACPMLNPLENTVPIKVLAAKNHNEMVRMQSSSGGIFHLIAKQTIERGGIVFGARFDRKWQVVMDYTDTIEGLKQFQGSKYVQCNTNDSFKHTKSFLDEGREVLFSGTPCMIAALSQFLPHEYANLLTLDIICHGVPSPLLWKRYIQECTYGASGINKNMNKVNISAVNFRSKRSGWKNFHVEMTIEDHNKNKFVVSTPFGEDLYMQAFLADMSLRPSCYTCPFRNGNSNSDITIGDYWNIQGKHPSMDDDKGTSLVMINSEKGISTFPYNNTEYLESNLDGLAQHNGGLKQFTNVHPKRKAFFREMEKTTSVRKLIFEKLHPSLLQRIIDKMFPLSNNQLD